MKTVTFRSPVIVTLVALGVLGGLTYLGEAIHSKVLTPQALYAAETTYDVALQAGNTYKSLCAKGLVETNCRATVARLQAFDAAYVAPAYRAVKGHETTAPADVARKFIDGVNSLKSQTPVMP
jgi:hypothetical protein